MSTRFLVVFLLYVVCSCLHFTQSQDVPAAKLVVSEVQIMGETFANPKSAKKLQLKKAHKLSSSRSDAKFDVTVKLTADSISTPHQTVVMFTHLTSGVATYFLLEKKKKSSTFQLSLPINMQSKRFQYNSGDYSIALLIGDSRVDRPFRLDFNSKIQLEFAAKPMKPTFSLYQKALLHESDTTLVALPEIKHIMRAQDKRPAVIVSYVFTGVIALPFFGFLIFAKKTTSLDNLPTSTTGLFYSLGFFISFGIVLGLFVVYWFCLTMFQLLGYLAIAGVFMIFFGHQTLRQLHSQNSLKASTKKKTE